MKLFREFFGNVPEIDQSLVTCNYNEAERFIRKLHPDEWKMFWRDYRYIHKHYNYSDPLSIMMALMTNEELVISYPAESTVRYVKKYFDMFDWQIWVSDNENGQKLVMVIIPNVNENVELVKKAVDLCGYFLGAPKENIYSRYDAVCVQFESKYQNGESDIIRKEEKEFIHITPKYNLGKIRNIGFSPRMRNEMFSYPDRIYFLRGSVKPDDLDGLMRLLAKSNSSKGNNGEYAVIHIDVSKIPKDVKMFLDPNYENGIFVIENISPDCISGVETVDLKK